MRLAWIAVPLVTLALAGCGQDTGPTDAPADAAATPARPATAKPAAPSPMSFEGMDADGDLRISSAEYAKAAQAAFLLTDADADGAITVAEMDAARTGAGAVGTGSSEKKIADLDGDGDGRLTLAEDVAGANALFDRMDANGDDVVDRPEWDKRDST